MKTLFISNKEIGTRQECFVVSEVGAMYEDLEGMKRLIKESKEAGADAVKLQTYRAETIALPGAEFEFEDGTRMSQFEFFKKYEISRENHKILFDYAKELGIIIFSTPSYYDDVEFLEDLGVPAFKTGADDLTNYPFLEYIAKKKKPLIISTGMATISEVEEAVQTILNTGNDQLILLHSTTSYPPEPQYANLNIIQTLRQAFNLPVGYSDHVFGTFSSVLAASMGACLIEKHFTLDRAAKKGDYYVSLEPAEMKKMVSEIRLINTLKGSSEKKVYPPEIKWRKNARKSLAAAKDMKSGEILSQENIKIIRPGTGIHPKYLKILLGKPLKKAIKKNALISFDDF